MVIQSMGRGTRAVTRGAGWIARFGDLLPVGTDTIPTVPTLNATISETLHKGLVLNKSHQEAVRKHTQHKKSHIFFSQWR
jgi:hypothetical protein